MQRQHVRWLWRQQQRRRRQRQHVRWLCVRLCVRRLRRLRLPLLHLKLQLHDLSLQASHMLC